MDPDVPDPNSTAQNNPASHAQGHWARVPQRKPVPLSTTVASTGGATNEVVPEGAKEGKTSASTSTRIWPFPSLSSLAARRRTRLFMIIGIVIAVLLIALIIGLAVGLTVGKKHSQNLPLPTSNGGPYKGDLTYYNPALGSCGITSADSDMVCAVSHVLFDAASKGSNPNQNPLCGMKIRVRRGWQSVDVKVVDRCLGCKEMDLDVTEAVFKKLADLNQGRVLMEWAWLESSPVSVS
ncbi:hypothetical protein NUU61_006855 [Penicillium alfredii]|uniref:RlpA-like protein double-psi beta-barrel domain-containing protein n=1 Tax=Penicillium alfredii TaxID=1506179 RepID=A0A9W9F1Q4_9EURO|nr:uncharacterized protein NUU61_006855 [Penicillium alfredii]KAJ5091985.1 hypothetical protein NUU61_006855 [Penicillium alfredii]